jgi:hypothetical protein
MRLKATEDLVRILTTATASQRSHVELADYIADACVDANAST